VTRIVVLTLLTVLSLTGRAASGSTALTVATTGPVEVSSQAVAAMVPTPAATADLSAGLPLGRVIRLVTLGDGYTAGTLTTVPRRDSWPAQLAESLAHAGWTVVFYNLAEQSATSGDLVELQLGQVESLHPDIVTVQVGVNDIVSGSTADYEANLETILTELESFLPAERILLVTTPDHTLTEWGKGFGPTESRGEAVTELNGTLREVGQEHGVEVVDIGPVNALVSHDASLLIQHDPPMPYPSAKQYAGWVEVIGPYVQDALMTLTP